jgi:hypothetical protein
LEAIGVAGIRKRRPSETSRKRNLGCQCSSILQNIYYSSVFRKNSLIGLLAYVLVSAFAIGWPLVFSISAFMLIINTDTSRVCFAFFIDKPQEVLASIRGKWRSLLTTLLLGFSVVYLYCVLSFLVMRDVYTFG